MKTEYILKVNSIAKALYENILNVVFAIILIFTTITIAIGAGRLFFRVGDLFKAGGITGDYLYIFTDVLTIFILIELSRSIYEYITIKQLRLVLVIDAAIVFILRDIMIGLFKHELSTETTYALSALLLVLGATRIGFGFVGSNKKVVSE